MPITGTCVQSLVGLEMRTLRVGFVASWEVAVVDSVSVADVLPALSVVLDRCAAGVSDPKSFGDRGQQQATVLAEVFS